MLQGSFSWNQYQIDFWHSSVEPPFAAEDYYLLYPNRQRLRIAVIDGSCNTHRCRDYAGVTAGTWASGTVASCLRSPQHIDNCLEWANRVLFDAQKEPGRHQLTAHAVVVDIGQNGELQIVRAGDCFVSWQPKKRWKKIFAGEARYPAAREKFARQLQKRFPAASAEITGRNKGLAEISYQFDLEQELFSDPASWSSAPIGYFPTVKLQERALPGDWQQLVLGTDGVEIASISENYLEDLKSGLEDGPEQTLFHIRKR